MIGLEEQGKEEVDALCPECGHAFKAYLDRVMRENQNAHQHIEESCPVCGCGECKIGK